MSVVALRHGMISALLVSAACSIGVADDDARDAIDDGCAAGKCDTLLDGDGLGLRVLGATADGDTTAVTLGWTPTGAATLEAAPSPNGPWTARAHLEPGSSSFTVEIEATRWFRLAVPGPGGATDTTRPIAARAVRAAAYHLVEQDVPGIEFPTALYGIVRYPAPDGARHPLVLLLHGNHPNCREAGQTVDTCLTHDDHECPIAGAETVGNAEGLIYLADTLAAQGYVAVSIGANALNCRSEFIVERTQLVLEHLRRWTAWSRSGAPFAPDLAGVDLSRVAVVGHSRGGEAVAHVPAALRAAPIAGVDVRSVYAIAPTDIEEPTITGADFGVLLPSCDGDVSTFEGLQHYDRSIEHVDGSRRSQVLFVGANHNFFNTRWEFDDNQSLLCDEATQVSAGVQQAVLQVLLSSWIDATLAGDELEPFVRGEGDAPEVLEDLAGRPLDLRFSYSAPDRLVVDDVRPAGAPLVNSLGRPNGFSAFDSAIACQDSGCGNRLGHTDKKVLALRWGSSTATPVATWDLGAVDARGFAALSFRVTSRVADVNDGLAVQDFVVRLRDAAGREAAPLLSTIKEVRHLYAGEIGRHREVLQTVRVPLDELLALEPTLDLGALTRLELEMDAPGHEAGAIHVSDVELAN